MKKFLSRLLAALAILLGLILWISSPPNRRVRFERDARSELKPSQISKSLSRYRSWPDWHHHLSSVHILGKGPEAELKAGETLQMIVEPKGKPWGRYEIQAQVLSYDPARSVRLKLLQDSTKRITAMFDDLEWEVSYSPETSGTRVKAEIEGTTRNWRSRLFSRIAPQILMNQVLYVDLFQLAGMDSPAGLELSPRD